MFIAGNSVNRGYRIGMIENQMEKKTTWKLLYRAAVVLGNACGRAEMHAVDCFPWPPSPPDAGPSMLRPQT